MSERIIIISQPTSTAFPFSPFH